MKAKSKATDASVILVWLSYITIAVAMNCTPLAASPVGGTRVANNTPSYVSTAKNLGAESTATLMEVTIWLQLHNRSEFDALTQSFYDRTSPEYHHWLKASDIATRFAPTAQEAKIVQEFMAGHNLTVVKVG